MLKDALNRLNEMDRSVNFGMVSFHQLQTILTALGEPPFSTTSDMHIKDIERRLDAVEAKERFKCQYCGEMYQGGHMCMAAKSTSIPAKPRAQGVDDRIKSVILDVGYELDEKVQIITQLVRHSPDFVMVPKDVAERWYEYECQCQERQKKDVELTRAIRKSLSK